MPRKVQSLRRSKRLSKPASKDPGYASQVLAIAKTRSLSQRKAAAEFGIKRGVLQSRAGGHKPIQIVNRRKRLLRESEEEALKQWILMKEVLHDAMPLSEVKKAAQVIVDARYACNSEPQVPPEVGQKWVSRFLKREDLQAFWSKGLDCHRVYALTQERKDRYFANVSAICIL